MILLLLVFWECGVGEGVQFGRFHTRTPEREGEGGREKVSWGVCVCASREDALRSELIGPIYRQFA